MKKIKEIADRYGYEGIERGLFVYILGPIALGIGFAVGFMKGWFIRIKVKGPNKPFFFFFAEISSSFMKGVSFMTSKEFEGLKNGDICKVIRGKDIGMKCVVLHKEHAPTSKVVLVKPAYSGEIFDSATVAYRYFKLFSHTELKVLSE